MRTRTKLNIIQRKGTKATRIDVYYDWELEQQTRSGLFSLSFTKGFTDGLKKLLN